MSSALRCLFVTHDGAAHEVLGMEYLSGALKAAGHETRACMESQAETEARTWNPDRVLFQVITGDQKRWGRVAGKLRDVVPDAKMVFGGPHFLFFSKVPQENADIILRGEAETSVGAAVEGQPWQDFAAAPDLDALPFPDRELFYNDRFPAIRDSVIRNAIACRGCPFRCTYCYLSNPNWQAMVKGKQRLRYHSPEYVAEEMARTFAAHGGALASFADDIFGIDLEWLERFAKVWRKEVNVPFFAQMRPALIKEDRVKLLKEAGIHIASFAIESGNEETRRMVLDRRETNEQILEGAALLHRYGIRFRMQNMLGLPVDDPLGDALETLRFNIKAKPTLSWCSLLQAYPGTKIADYVVAKGIVPSLEALEPMVDADFFGKTSLPIRDVEKIERLHKYWSAVVRWPWLYPLVWLLVRVWTPKRVLEWVFETSKQYINQRDYWHVRGRGAVVARGSVQPDDRLGNEFA